MPHLMKDKNSKLIDHTHKDQKRVRDLLIFEFEVVAVFGLIISLSSFDLSKVHISIFPAVLAVTFYYIAVICAFILPILFDYINERKRISEERVDLGYKLIFLKIIITIVILPNMLFLPVPLWSNILIDVLIIFMIISTLLRIGHIRRKRHKILKQEN